MVPIVSKEDIVFVKKILEELKKIKGRGTELVTVYVPSGYDIKAVQRQLEQEWTTAQNIKSDTTRRNVQAALERIINAIKPMQKTPPNGLAIFCGNVDGNIKLWLIEPPVPLTIKLYRCDSRFVTEPLEDTIRATEGTYGLVVVDSREATFGILKGKKIEVIKRERSLVPPKHRKGGQSAQRFAREREGLLRAWMKKVADLIKELYSNIPDLKGILFGGPAGVKDTIYNEYLDNETKKKIIGVIDTGYTDEYGLKELIERGRKYLQREEIIEEKELVRKFFEHIVKDDGLSVYGEEDVKNALQLGAVDVVLVSEELPAEKLEEIIKMAKEFGSRVFFVSKDTDEGAQFHRFANIGAILRFKI